MDNRNQSERFFKAAFCGLVVAAAFLFIWAAADVLLIAFAGVLLAIIIRSASDFIVRLTGLKVGWSIAIVMICGFTLLGLGILFTGPAIAAQIDQLRRDLPASLSSARSYMARYGWARDLLNSAPASSDIASRASNIWAHVLGTVSITLSVAADLVVISFVGLYFAINPGLYRRGILLLIPTRGEERAREVMDQLHGQLRYWLMGKLALMVFVGLATALGLWILHMPLIAILAVLAALLDFIPNIGPLISAVPAVLLALTQSPAETLWVAGLYLAVQIVESYILQPLIQQRAVSLPPSLTLCTQVMAGTLLGMFGLIVATPLTVAAMNLIQALYVEDYLGKSTVKR